MSFTPYVCMQTHSTCYKATKPMKVKGILWHSTGSNNPNLSRYVQPFEGDANYNEAIKKLGKNKYGNDWNHIYREAGLNAWIGKFADGKVGTVQTMPWDYRPWGCGQGSKGSCNDGWIQFEICEDALTDKAYAQKVWDEAIALSVFLCKKFNLDPNGTVTMNGTKVPVITCHNDSYKIGFGSGHADINHWFPKILKKDMNDARKEIAAKLKGEKASSTGTSSTSEKKTQSTTPATSTPAAAKSYIVQINTAVLNIRSGAGTNYSIIGTVKNKERYTIVEEKNGWGLLKAYQKKKNGWIKLSYTKKV